MMVVGTVSFITVWDIVKGSWKHHIICHDLKQWRGIIQRTGSSTAVMTSA